MMLKKKALEIISHFNRSGVLVVGDVMVDHFIWGKVSRISPEAPVPVVDVQKDSVMLGGCANVLNTIYAMGGRVFVAGVIGNDDVGKGLIRQLEERALIRPALWSRSPDPRHSKPVWSRMGNRWSGLIMKAKRRFPHPVVKRFCRMSNQNVTESAPSSYPIMVRALFPGSWLKASKKWSGA